jgi:hypothetical protein
MPKVGYAAKDLAPDTGFGFERGKGEVVEAKTKIHQYPKSTKEPSKEQSAPFICVQLGIMHLNDALERIDDEVKYVELGLGRKGLTHFSVGVAKNAKDDNPQDLGQALDTEGNCIFPLDGEQIHPKTPWGRFVSEAELKDATGIYKGLQKAGFKPEVLGDGFIPDLIGMKAEFGHVKLEKWDGFTGEGDPSAFMVKQIFVYPYENKSKKAAPAKNAKDEKAVTSHGAPAGTAQAGTPTNGQAGDLMAFAVKAATAVVGDVKGSDMDLKAFRGKVQQKLLKLEIKPATMHPKVLELLKSADTTAEIGAQCGFMVDEDGKLVWAE